MDMHEWNHLIYSRLLIYIESETAIQNVAKQNFNSLHKEGN